MRYPRERKAQSREKLVRAGAALAKREGFAPSGVDALADAAGVTSGAFYRHFDGKADLLAAIVAAELDGTRARFAATDDLLGAVDRYLSLGHVRHPEAGCVLPALAAEIARAPAATRTVFERAFVELEAVLADKLGDAALAATLITQCVGAVMLARCLASDEARRALLEATRASARALIARRA